MIDIYKRILDEIEQSEMNALDMSYFLGACDVALWQSSISFLERAKLLEIAISKYNFFCRSLKG